MRNTRLKFWTPAALVLLGGYACWLLGWHFGLWLVGWLAPLFGLR